MGAFSEDFAETFLYGYYPVYLYSTKVHYIPESLNTGKLPPLHLVDETQASPYLRFMGSNMNTDSKTHFFRLEGTEILKDVPTQKYSFGVSFDMLIFEKLEPVFLPKRFNFLHLYLFGVDSSSNEILLTKVSVDLYVFNINRDPINTNQFDAIFKLIILYIENGIQKGKDSDQSVISFPKQGSKTELINSNNNVYQTQKTKNMKLQGFLSDQLFLFKVNEYLSNKLIKDGN